MVSAPACALHHTNHEYTQKDNTLSTTGKLFVKLLTAADVLKILDAPLAWHLWTGLETVETEAAGSAGAGCWIFVVMSGSMGRRGGRLTGWPFRRWGEISLPIF
jgi:hypothetical protein